MTWLPEQASGATPRDRLLGLRPNLDGDLRAFEDLLWSGRPIDPALLELCRRRIAQLHDCPAELARRGAPSASDATPAGLARRPDAAELSPLERDCLRLAEKFALEPHAVSDADVGAVAAALSPAELIALVEGLAIFDGFTRVQILLGAARDGGPAGAVERLTAAARTPHTPSSRARLMPPPTDGTNAIAASVLAHQPELLRAFLRLYGTLWSEGVVDHPTKEVLRIRNARITGCNYCKNVRFAEARRQGLGEEQVSLVEDGWQESALGDRHKAALGLADAFLLDPHGLRPQVRDDLLRHFSAPEIVEMAAGLALFMGFSKITVVLGREPVDMPTTVVPTPTREAS